MEDKVITIQIKNRYNGDVIFEHSQENNSLRKTVIQAMLEGKSLAQAELMGADLSWLDLSHVDFNDANLRGAAFHDSCLAGSRLQNANLVAADLSFSNLTGTCLAGASLMSADLTQAELKDTDLDKALLEGAIVGRSDDADGYTSVVELIRDIRREWGIKLKKFYENHDALSSMQGDIWKNLIVIQEWELVKDGNKIQLSDEEKAAIKAFAELHATSTLEHIREKLDGQYYSRFTYGGRDLELTRLVEGLGSDRSYTLEELGIQ